ncbi:cytosolic phospholipase A2 [Pelomyxa schiedti]|nr:cytosolic phospholipase A2 [Pelomyxa schiedti]
MSNAPFRVEEENAINARKRVARVALEKFLRKPPNTTQVTETTAPTSVSHPASSTSLSPKPVAIKTLTRPTSHATEGGRATTVSTCTVVTDRGVKTEVGTPVIAQCGSGGGTMASLTASSSRPQSQSTSSPACTTSTCTERGGAKTVEAEPLVIAICGSGGGMRAMQSMVGFMDGLSHIGLLDAVTFAVGLSGSTWCLSQWVCDTEGNPFHGSTCADDPWRAGGPPFDERRHTHSELKKMLSQHSWLTACGEVAACVVRKGSLVGGWAEFLSDVVLSRRHLESTRFSQCKNRLADGSFPIPVCTAISENEQDNWDWVDFTPFTVRKCGTPLKATENLSDDTLPHLMAVWGSFFAVDWKGWHAEIPKVLKWLPAISTVPEPGRKRKAMACETAFEENIGNLRDAGIDFNVPLPALRGRGVDVVLVMDASEGAKGAKELALAVKAGHIGVAEEDKNLLTRDFGPRERCRLFYPERTGQPAIAYFLCHTQSATVNLQYEPQHVEGIVQSVCNAVISESGTLRQFLRRLEDAKRSAVIPVMPCGSRQSPLREVVRPALKQCYCKLYELMALLDHLGHMQHRPPFSVLYTSLQVADAGMHGGLGQSVGIDVLWSAVLRTGNTRCVVEGDPGSGKSTLVKFLAREQGTVEMEQQFGAIVVVELRELCSTVIPSHEPLSLRNCVQEYLLRVLKLDCSIVQALFLADPNDILWVFDGFDEVDTRRWESFLDELVHNHLDWAPCVMVTSRHDRRHQFFTAATTVIVQQWNPAEIDTYIKRYFDYVNEFGSTADSRAIQASSVCKFISDNPELARMAKTPLLCEIICTVYSKIQSDTNPSVTTIFKHLVAYAWERTKTKLSIADDSPGWHQDMRAANYILCERSYDTTIGTMADDLAGVFRLSMNKPIEKLACCCGLVRRCSRFDYDTNVHGFRFIHKTLEEFFTAWHICSKKNAPIATALLDGIFVDQSTQQSIKWSPKERNLVLFIAGFIHSSKKHYIKQIQEPFIGSLLAVFNFNYKTNYQELSADLSRDASHPTRDRWRVQLGLDAVVAAVTLLGSYATERFLKSIRPYGWQASRVIPRSLTLKVAPWIYRLLAEPCARYGNLDMLKRVVIYAAGEMDQALLEAHLSGQQRAIDWLTSMNAGGVSIRIPARMGNHQAVCQMLAQVQDIEKKKEQALEAAFEATNNGQACVLSELCKLYSPNDLLDGILTIACKLIDPRMEELSKVLNTTLVRCSCFRGVTKVYLPSFLSKEKAKKMCFEIAESLPALTSLDTFTMLPEDGIRAIAKSCGAITELRCRLSLNGFCGAAPFFQSLRSLHLDNELKGSLPNHSVVLPSLTSLYLYSGVSLLAPLCPGLTSLTCISSKGVTNEDACALARYCTYLTTLRLYRTTSESVAAIANHLVSLTDLTLENYDFIEGPVPTDVDANPIVVHCPRLRRLFLGPTIHPTSSSSRNSNGAPPKTSPQNHSKPATVDSEQGGPSWTEKTATGDLSITEGGSFFKDSGSSGVDLTTWRAHTSHRSTDHRHSNSNTTEPPKWDPDQKHPGDAGDDTLQQTKSSDQQKQQP